MGVIKKVLYRGNDLQLASYRNLFLDMEENIHIHYRDLRIELSRKEFEEIANTFVLQSSELLEIIHNNNYQDGKLSNSNHNDVRIWTESRLNHPVKYHPNRISIEECTDGYHLHLRNYKFLLSKDDFKAFYNAICSIDLDSTYVSERKDVIQLFTDNELDFIIVKEDSEQDISHLLVADYHLSKIRGICKNIGLTESISEKQYQIKNDHTILIINSVPAWEISKHINRSDPGFSLPASLVSFLLESKQEQNQPVNNNVLNLIKCQILDLFNYVKQKEKLSLSVDVDLDYRSWTYNDIENKVVFPFKASTERLNEKQISSLYQEWSDFLKQNDLFFIKPDKLVFDAEQQQMTRHQIYTELVENIARVEAVSRIYLMGSLVRGDMGIYRCPFVHSKWAKLGSDVDILIEMDIKSDSADSKTMPAQWRFINKSQSNSCDIYHLSQVSLTDHFGFEKQFPNIDFYHHLIDAFVYFPDRADAAMKDEFLNKFNAQLFYSKFDDDQPDILFEKEEEINDPWAEPEQEIDEEEEDIYDPWAESEQDIDEDDGDIDDPWAESERKDQSADSDHEATSLLKKKQHKKLSF